MTDQEIVELPKVWVVGGDGRIGDIGYQNTSKVMLQNRPNVKVLMLGQRQVYSNTGGQTPTRRPMLGGGDMNTFGSATQGKNTEKKTVAETFLAGMVLPLSRRFHGHAPKLYRAILDGLEYRGTMFLQAFTTCQPEPAWPTTWRSFRAGARLRAGAPEFVFNPRMGETYQEALDNQGQSVHRSRLYETKSKVTGETSRYIPWRTGA